MKKLEKCFVSLLVLCFVFVSFLDFQKIKINFEFLAPQSETSRSLKQQQDLAAKRVKDLREFYDILYEAFAQLKPRSDGGIFQAERLNWIRSNFEFKDDGSIEPRGVDIYNLVIPIHENKMLSHFLSEVVDEIIQVLPKGVSYHRVPPELYHMMICVPQDITHSLMNDPESKKMKLTEREVKEVENVMEGEISKHKSYQLRLVRILFCTDGSVIGVFDDAGETIDIRENINEKASQVSPRVKKAKYPKQMLHVALLRILKDIPEGTLLKLKKLAEKYKNIEDKNLAHRVDKMVFGHEIQWLYTKIEEGSKRIFFLRNSLQSTSLRQENAEGDFSHHRVDYSL